MQLYLTRRNLNGIAGIDLAGITPLVEKTVTLGDGADYGDKARSIDLPLTKDGAYLVMLRGDNLYASGIVLVSPIEIEVLEDEAEGRVRVTVRDVLTKDFLSKVQVKVIGSDNPQFISGEADLRGVFVAEGVRGVVTAVARKGANQYAFYRGTNLRRPGGSAPQRESRCCRRQRTRHPPNPVRKNAIRPSTPISRCRIRPTRCVRSSGSSSATISPPASEREPPRAGSVDRRAVARG